MPAEVSNGRREDIFERRKEVQIEISNREKDYYHDLIEIANAHVILLFDSTSESFCRLTKLLPVCSFYLAFVDRFPSGQPVRNVPIAVWQNRKAKFC